MNPPAPDWIDYDYAFLRVVPHPHLGTFVTVGVVLHARTAEYLGVRIRRDRGHLLAPWPDLDADLVDRTLEAWGHVCAGGAEGGAIGLLPPSERFHWLTTPRSGVVQISEVHGGRTRDPEGTLAHLFASCVLVA
jgi:hypothetical protein